MAEHNWQMITLLPRWVLVKIWGAGRDFFDVTHARSQFDYDDNESGQSYRFLYSKRFEDTNTTFRLVGYRYSMEGFYTLNEWVSRQDNDSDFWVTGNRRSRFEGTGRNLSRQAGAIFI